MGSETADIVSSVTAAADDRYALRALLRREGEDLILHAGSLLAGPEEISDGRLGDIATARRIPS